MFWKILKQFLKQKMYEIKDYSINLMIIFLSISLLVVAFAITVYGLGGSVYFFFKDSGYVNLMLTNVEGGIFDKIFSLGVLHFVLIPIILIVVLFIKWLCSNWKYAKDVVNNGGIHGN